jgi:type II secretory pathway component PulF
MYQILLSVFCLVLVLLLLPYLLEGVENFVLKTERRFRPLLRFMPIASRAVRVEQQARWLGALSLGLSSGVPPDQAVRAAGMICDGAMERRSLFAAELVAAGHPIGRACVQARVLERTANHRLALLDGRADYLEGLRSIAADNSQMAYEWLQRSGRLAEICLLIVLGLMAGMFAIAMYLPLFNIPKIVGVGD